MALNVQAACATLPGGSNHCCRRWPPRHSCCSLSAGCRRCGFGLQLCTMRPRVQLLPHSLLGKVPQEHKMRTVSGWCGLQYGAVLKRKLAWESSRHPASMLAAGTGRSVSPVQEVAAREANSRSHAAARWVLHGRVACACAFKTTVLLCCVATANAKMVPCVLQILKSHPVTIRSEANKKRRQVGRPSC
jgi:hypothetical protein